MLLEMALAEFSHDRDWEATGESPGSNPVESPSRQSQERGSRLEWRGQTSLPRSGRTMLVCEDVQEEPQKLPVREEVSSRKLTIHRSQPSQEEAASTPSSLSSDQFYDDMSAVPFEQEDAPGKSRLVLDSQSSGRSSHASPLPSPRPSPLPSPRPSPLPSPPALRLIAAASPRSVRTVASPIRGGFGGAVKGVHGGKSLNNVKESKPMSERTTPHFAGRGLEDVDREMLDSSDDGEATSPVSTLDLPLSPLGVSRLPQQHLKESVERPHHHARESSTRQGGKSSQARPTSHWTNTLVSEDLPAVMEEDEENLESAYGYHTMEFQALDSPSTSEDRRDWKMSGRNVSSKSFSAPNSRQNSSLRPTAANRGRRRSDFDWPEDFEERPEEVVKEVDESLWAFSPVRSTFVFSGNDTADGGNRPQMPGATGTRTPPGSSPGLGSVLEHITFKKSLGRSASKTPPSKSPRKGEYPSQRSSWPKQYGVNGEDDCPSPRGQSTKRSYTCLPFFSLCSAQRPSTISFSQRLGPTLSNLNNSSLGNLNN